MSGKLFLPLSSESPLFDYAAPKRAAFLPKTSESRLARLSGFRILCGLMFAVKHIEYLRALCRAAIRRGDMQQAMFIVGIIVLTPNQQAPCASGRQDVENSGACSFKWLTREANSATSRSATR